MILKLLALDETLRTMQKGTSILGTRIKDQVQDNLKITFTDKART